MKFNFALILVSLLLVFISFTTAKKGKKGKRSVMNGNYETESRLAGGCGGGKSGGGGGGGWR